MVALTRPTIGLALALIGAGAFGCPYSIRDAGFIVRDPAPFRILTFAQDAEGAKALRAEADKLADSVLARSNVRIEVAEPGSEEYEAGGRVCEECGQAQGEDGSDALLVSPDGRRLSLCLADFGGDLPRLAREVAQSTVRDRIIDGAINHWCVLVVGEGADEADNAEALAAANAVAGALPGFKPEMGARITEAPPVVTLAASGGDRILWWSLGLDDCAQDRAKVAVVFGRGRRLGPVLWGATLTQRNIRDAVELLGRNCTCTSEPGRILGPTIPSIWTDDRQALVREKLGFDPDAPTAMAALSGVWTDFRDGVKREPGEYIPDPGSGYIELPFGDEEEPQAEGEGGPTGDPQAAAPDELEKKSLRAAAVGVGVVAVIVIGGAAALLIRQRGRV